MPVAREGGVLFMTLLERANEPIVLESGHQSLRPLNGFNKR